MAATSSTATASPVWLQGVFYGEFSGDDPRPTVEPDVVGRDAAGTLAFLMGEHAREEAAAVQKLRAVMHYADLHRAGGMLDGAMDAESREWLLDDDGNGSECELRSAGEGTFMVSEFAVTELAAALGMSEAAGRAYVGQAVELRDRLPKVWSQVLAGRLPAWRGRLIGKDTIPLNAEAAAFVDAALAPFAHQVSPWRVARAVEAAVLRHDPELAERRARAAAEKRGVWVVDGLDGTSELHAVANTPDVAAFDAALDAVATTLGALGDSDLRQARRAKALGVLADPQHALDLHDAAEREAGDTTGGTPPRRSPGGRSFHVHLHADALVGAAPVARVADYGARAVAAVEQWLADLAPGTVVTVTPVVDLTEHVSVDAYEVPDRLRNLVQERDLCCVFPWCGRPGLFDVDHVEEYVPMDEGGPPGQTNSDNSGRLCRYHHRVKTHPGRHGRWRYRRRPTGTYLWTSPLGRRYAVDTTGTRPLD